MKTTPTTRSDCNSVLREATKARQAQMNIVHDAKYEIRKIEEGVKKELVRQRRTECLTIDWKAVERAVKF